MELKIMDSKQEAKFKMYNVVITRCDDNISIVDLNVAFKNAFTDFKAFVEQIGANAQKAGVVLKGITADKTVSKKDLSANAAKMGGLIYAYAAKNGNNGLKQSVDFSKSDLMKVKDGEIAAICQIIHDAGVENKAALKDYGVTDEKLANLQAAIDGYTGEVSKPRSAIIDRKVTKAQTKELFKQADEILVEQMDKLIEDFFDTNAEFVAQYKSARIIIDPKTGKTITGENANNPTA
ncbi:MAG: hypothetical protein ABWZ66_01620 [Pyrinomonadaceae bacterium]